MKCLKNLEVRMKSKANGISTVRLDHGGKYLGQEFLDHLKENKILLQWSQLKHHNQKCFESGEIRLCWT